MISRRYTDWFVTTPLMLISTVIFMKYNHYKETNDYRRVTFKNFLLEDSDKIKKNSDTKCFNVNIWFIRRKKKDKQDF